MPEFMSEEQFTRVVATALSGGGVRADPDQDIVNGSLTEVIHTVLDLYGQYGPVVFDDRPGAIDASLPLRRPT
jgi:hypothetical protein